MIVAEGSLRGSLLAGLVAVALGGCNPTQPQQAGAPPMPEVGFVTVHTRAVEITNELPGRTVPSLIAEVRPQVNGIIQKRPFEEGSEVKQGSLLYQIDDRVYQAAYDNAAASLARAKAAVTSARNKAARYQELQTKQIVSQQDLEAAAAASEQADADVAAADAGLESARINLDYTKVVAPISGRVGLSIVTPGALVTANQTTALATIQALDPMFVDVTQSATEVLRLRRQIESGQLQRDDGKVKVRLLFDDGSRYDEEGVLKFVDLNVGQSTGTVTLRATFPNPKRVLLPGMFVRAVVDAGTNAAAILAPARAVSRTPRGQATALVVGKENKVEQRTLQVTQMIGGNWLVETGLAEGDQLIVDGLQKVRPGAVVKPVEVSLDTAQATPAKKPN